MTKAFFTVLDVSLSNDFAFSSRNIIPPKEHIQTSREKEYLAKEFSFPLDRFSSKTYTFVLYKNRFYKKSILYARFG